MYLQPAELPWAWALGTLGPFLLLPPSCQEWQSSTYVGDLPVYLSQGLPWLCFVFTLSQGLK